MTHIFVRGDELLDRDSVFGVKESLVKDFERQAPGTPTPDGRHVEDTWSKVRFDVVLRSERIRRGLPPIRESIATTA